MDTFEDINIRHGFVRKVYTILFVQLAITTAITCWFILDDDAAKYLKMHHGVLILLAVLQFVLLIIIMCVEKARTVPPFNFIMLFLFTIVFSFLFADFATYFSIKALLYATGITFVIFLSLTIFACQTKIDFTLCGAVMLILPISLFIVGLVAIFFPTDLMITIYGSLGAIVFSLFLVYDTQLIIGGDHRFAFDPNDYIMAALCLYLDVVYLLYYILLLFGSFDDDD